MPFTEAELSRMLDIIPNLYEKETDANRVRVMVKFMAATGTAIVDTVALERTSLKKERDGQTWLKFHRRKTGTLVQQVLDPALAQELLQVVNGNPKYIFWSTGNGKASSAVTNWRDDELVPLMKAAGCYVPGNVAHRFRDTAVDFWYGNGESLAAIAAMLGDTEKVVLKHYRTSLGRFQEQLGKVTVRKWDNAKAAAAGEMLP